jgi:hypothetical protein
VGAGAAAQFQTNISGKLTFYTDNLGAVCGRTDSSYQGWRFGALIGSETIYGAMWVGSAAISPSSSNYAIAFNSTESFIGCTTLSFGNGYVTIAGGSVTSTISVAGTNGALQQSSTSALIWNASGVQLGATVAFGGGVGVLGITNATTAPSSSPSGGVVLYAQSAKAIGLMGSAANALIISADGTNGYGFIPNSSTTAAGLQVSLTGQTTSFAGAAGGNVQITAGQGNGTGTCAGGGVAISSASGSAALKAGVVAIQVAGTTQWSFGPTGLAITSASVTMATSGATTLTQAQYQCSLLIIATVSFTGATTLVFPGQTGVWFVDVSKVTLSTGSLAFVNGSGNSPSISTATGTQIVMVSCTGANTIVINQ